MMFKNKKCNTCLYNCKQSNNCIIKQLTKKSEMKNNSQQTKGDD